MADNLEHGELVRQILTAIGGHVAADTNYWGEFEQINPESLTKAAMACEKLIFSLKPEQFQTEQTMHISVRFAEWMQKENRTGNWNENYKYFLQNIYITPPAETAQTSLPVQPSTIAIPGTLSSLKKAR